MLHQLLIRNIVTIAEAELTFGPGLCVLTGETGAGKSILLGALGLALGERADQKLLRAGAEEACVTALFDLTPAIAQELEVLGLSTEDDQLLLRRHLQADGKSRAFINDQPVSITALKQIGERLIEIHGQHDQRQLSDANWHRDLLDRYAGLTAQRLQLAEAHSAWHAAIAEAETLQAQLAEAQREQDYLQHVAAELSSLAPADGEAEELQETRRTLMQSEKLALTLQEVDQAFSADTSPRAQIYAIERLLSRAHVSLQEPLEPVMQALTRAQDAVEEATDLLQQLSNQYDYDPQRLETTESRLFALNAAARKHQVTVDELPALLARVNQNLQMLDAQEQYQARLAAEVARTRTVYLQAAEHLHLERQKAATQLEKALTKELKPLKMEQTQCKFSFSQLSESQWQAGGMYRVVLEVSTNAGSSFGPLHQVASGGEQSRFMLALKSLLASKDEQKLLLFDEIDTGTGGAVADAIGARLASLGKSQQVVVVTHLPQVAARASLHTVIEKITKKNQTFTQTRLLDKTQHEEELARMLAGAIVTPEARLAARKLVESAA